MLLDLFFIIEEKKKNRLILPYLKNTFSFLVPSATQVMRKIFLSGIGLFLVVLSGCSDVFLLTKYQTSVSAAAGP